MARNWRYFSLAMIVATTFAIAVSVGDKAVTAPNDVELICQIESVRTQLSNGNIIIPINVTNIDDSIAGFQLWVNISDNSLVKFKVDHIDYSGDTTFFAKYDTVGTRIQGWEYIQARILDDTLGGLLNIIGKANDNSPPIKPPLIPGSGTFIKVFCETNGALGDSIADSVTIFLTLSTQETRFSDPRADLIAYSCCCPYVDTLHPGGCASYIGDSCIAWFDTVYSVHQTCWFDSAKGIYLNGKITFQACKCGDADGNGSFNISDAVRLINYIFGGAAAPNPICRGDADGNNSVNISDVVRLINYIFAGAAAPKCPS